MYKYFAPDSLDDVRARAEICTSPKHWCEIEAKLTSNINNELNIDTEALEFKMVMRMKTSMIMMFVAYPDQRQIRFAPCIVRILCITSFR